MSDMQRASFALQSARSVVFFTGAGISAESGIPTFRDKLTGLWAGYDPQRLETAEAFRANPALVWGWYLWRKHQTTQAQPNAAHLVPSRLAATGRQVSVVTQNIDDLHERAGSVDVIHLHGSLAQPKCFACHRPAELSEEQQLVHAVHAVHGDVQEVEPPRCRRCNGKLRPAVVWFKEDLPRTAWKTAMEMVTTCQVLVSVGTSGIVTPAADIPEIALAAGATLIHVNLEDVSLDNANELMLIGSASEVLPALLKAAFPTA